jgi:NAD(P)-dependent dehydrogenase (short-subunit alcohol dehydrogenase family)
MNGEDKHGPREDNSNDGDDTLMKPKEKRPKIESSNEKPRARIVDPNALLPQLDGVTEGDVQTAIRVLNAVSRLDPKLNLHPDGLELYRQSNLRPFRKALSSCMELHQKTMFHGKSELEHFEQRKAERTSKRQKASERHHQKNYIASTTLRKGRVEKLEKLKNDAKHEEEAKLMSLMVPDGHVEATPMLLENNAEYAPKTLPNLRSCYVCKVRFRDLHHFYDQLCPKCAPDNWDKRHQTADLHGKVAVVTGSRVKIGYQTCLKLLRAGATVVATSRFPNAAAAAYRQEDDFLSFNDQLHVYGLDLRDVTGLEAFTRFLKMKYTNGIDILINNACQTVRRPRGYYVPMMEKEQTLWSESDPVHKSLLDGCVEFERVRRQILIRHRDASQGTAQIEGEDTAPLIQMTIDSDATTLEEVAPTKVSGEIVVSTVDEESETSPFETTGVSHSAAMSQMVILPEDVGVPDSVLPPGLSDVNGQQLDLRSSNSWLLKMEEVSTPEIMECMFINAIAPFVLNSRLKPLMAFPNNEDRPDRFIINVSAMEGKFYRYKMPNHPHTNMAKAALNMLTRTSAEDLAKEHRIFMNAVDTGWINDENPLEKASKTAKQNLFQTPIDEIDAAARILDPIFSGVNAGRVGEKESGKFLKDYRETEW